MTNISAQIAAAFNGGCDARIAGLPLNCYVGLPWLRDHWRAGWLHVNRYWGWDERRRPICTLPRIHPKYAGVLSA